MWHGADPNDPGRFIPRRNTFTFFRHVPSQIYVNVRDVRTNDDTLITVKLMVFYELKNIERMVSVSLYQKYIEPSIDSIVVLANPV